MKKKGDFGDNIVEEVLSETANDFFGKRKKIEIQVDTLKSYADALLKKSQRISKHLSFLNYLLLETQLAKDFFKQIGLVENDLLLKEKQPNFDTLPKKLKLGFRAKTKYTRLVMHVYIQVQNLCEAYHSGSLDEDEQSEIQFDQERHVNYQFIMNMVGLINDNIRKVNSEKSPSSVLQFAKSFNSGTSQKEKITGSMSSEYNQHLNAKMRIEPLDVKTLMLDDYPMLPKPQSVAGKIDIFCRQLFKSHKKETEKILSAYDRYRGLKIQ